MRFIKKITPLSFSTPLLNIDTLDMIAVPHSSLFKVYLMLILGSSSPRRKEILEYFSLPFRVVSPSFEEEKVSFSGDPIKYVEEIALGKAKSLQEKESNFPLVTADTTVFCKGQILNKPKDHDEALAMLRLLSGTEHFVYTGMCAIKGDKVRLKTEKTSVFFHEMTEEQLQLYHKAIYSQDKAGGYAIQEAGAIAIRKIEGCFFNVMGLPIYALASLLEELGISLWHHLSHSF